jgi:hypothetical protein
MAITLTNNSATIGATEFFLASNSTTKTSQTTVCILQVFLDLSALTAGEEYLIQCYEKVNGGTDRVFYKASKLGTQNEPHWVSPSFIVGDGWEVSVKKIVGTDRAIPWSLRKVS